MAKNRLLDGCAPGVTFGENGNADVLLWAPKAEQVELLINSHQKMQLKQAEFGYWKISTANIKPGDMYLFILDGDKILPDPASLSQPDGVHGASEAVDLKAFNWADESWQNPALNNYVFYELHTGTFTPGGSFAGIENKLNYLKDLGITAIEIMPVAQFPGNRNWGYDGVFPYTVQNSYGGYDGLMQLVNACHQKGIAVVLDVVYNHLGPEGNYFGEYGHYFTDKYHTPWGDAINFDDEGCDAVRHYFIQNVLMWFRDFHIDALRMDAVHAIKDFSPKHILAEIKEAVDGLVAETGKTHHLIVELDLNDNRFINPLSKSGYGMDAQWIDEFHHALRVTAGGERDGYYADFNGIADLAKSYNDAYVYDGMYSPQRKKTFGTKAIDNTGNQFVVFSQNHDQVGNSMLGERSSQIFSFEMQKLMAGAVMVSPFLPMLFMGEEWSAPNPFQFFVSHTDPELVEAVRKGRKAEFAAFHAEGEAPDPQAEETFERSRLSWDLIAEKPHQQMLNYYKTLIKLRKQNTALSTLNRRQLETTTNESNKTLLLRRWHGDEEVCCLMNFSEKQQTINLPWVDNWKKDFDSADVKWNGPGASMNLADGSALINIQPQSIIIYTNSYV